MRGVFSIYLKNGVGGVYYLLPTLLPITYKAIILSSVPSCFFFKLKFFRSYIHLFKKKNRVFNYVFKTHLNAHTENWQLYRVLDNVFYHLFFVFLYQHFKLIKNRNEKVIFLILFYKYSKNNSNKKLH